MAKRRRGTNRMIPVSNAQAILKALGLWEDHKFDTVDDQIYWALEYAADALVGYESPAKAAISRAHKRRMKRNPSLVVYNPPEGMRVRRTPAGRIAGIIGQNVHQIKYQHADDGENYYHDFGKGVKMFALDSGDVLLTSDKPLWEDFE